MTLADRLRPRWRHSDPAVRRREVESVTDRGTLETILESTAPEDVRQLAAERLFSDEHVRTHARRAVREAAVHVLTNPDILQWIAERDSDQNLRALALSRLGNDGAVRSCGVCGTVSLVSTVVCKCGFDFARGELEATRASCLKMRRRAKSEMVAGATLVLLSLLGIGTAFPFHFVFVFKTGTYAVDLVLLLPGCLLIAGGWRLRVRPWLGVVSGQAEQNKSTIARLLSSLYQRWVVTGAITILVGGCGFALLKRLTVASCREREPSSVPELTSRSDEILRELETDPQSLISKSSALFRQTMPANSLAEFESNVLPILKIPRRVREVWHAVNPAGILHGDGQSSVTVCRETPIYSDSMAFPREAKEVAAVFYEIDQSLLSYRLMVQLFREAGRWRLGALSIQPYRHRGNDAQHFEHLGDERSAKNQEGDALLAYLAAEKLSVRARQVETTEHQRIASKLALAAAPTKFGRIFSQDNVPRENEYLQISMEAVSDGGLLPMVSFVSSNPSDGGEAKAQALVRALARQVPSLRADFSAVATRAYPEAPRAGQSYERFGVVVPTDSLQQ